MKLETDLVIHLIARIRKKANKFIVSELEKHGVESLAPVHGDVLYALFRYDELSMKAIADLVGRKKSTITTLIDKLINMEYVEKKRDENDNRSFRISLTGKGRKLSSTINEISENLLIKTYKDMPIEERMQLMKSLRKIDDNW